MSRKDKTAPTVVDAVREQTEQAAALAAIDGQARLADPRLNPATRGHADALRGEQLTRALDAEHSRLLRRHRVADRRAAEAEETLQAIALARQAASPARSVRALHKGQRAYSRIALTASVVLAAGSAMGVEAAAQHLAAPTGTGYVAEVGLTGLATAAIMYRAHLAEHRGLLGNGWQRRTLWALMTVPLLVSIAANLATVNALGAACALGAAAFSVLACVVADRSAAAMQARVAEVSQEDEQTLHAVAMGEDLFTPVADGPQNPEGAVRRPDECDRPRTRTRESGSAEGRGDAASDTPHDQPERGEADEVADAARIGVDELTAWLADQEPPEEGAAPRVSPDPEGGPSSAARDLPHQREDRDRIDGGTTPREGGHIDTDQSSRTERAAEARRAAGAATQARIVAYLANHPRASNSRVAADLDLSVATVKRHRRSLRRGDIDSAGGDQ